MCYFMSGDFMLICVCIFVFFFFLLLVSHDTHRIILRRERTATFVLKILRFAFEMSMSVNVCTVIIAINRKFDWYIDMRIFWHTKQPSALSEIWSILLTPLRVCLRRDAALRSGGAEAAVLWKAWQPFWYILVVTLGPDCCPFYPYESDTRHVDITSAFVGEYTIADVLQPVSVVATHTNMCCSSVCL